MGLNAREKFAKKIEVGASKIISHSKKLADRCEFPDSWKFELEKEEDEDEQRYDRDDPCKAIGQIAKGFLNI